MSDSIQIDQLIAFLEKSPEYKEKLANLFYPSEFAKKDELSRILDEMAKNRIETSKRFEESRKETNKRFDLIDKRFEESQKETNRRFEESQKETNKRFDMVDKRFDKVFQRFDDLSMSLGHDFEEFNSLWLQEYLIVQGFPKINIVKKTFYDKDYFVFPDNQDIEIDLFNADPLIIGEVTAITKSIKKINIFIKKVKFIENLFEREAHSKIFITYAFLPKIRAEAFELLKKNDIKIFVLRQRGLEDL